VHTTYTTAGIYLRLTESRKKIFILTVVLVLFGILGIYLLSNYFVNPILNITRRVRRFTSGELETELPLTGAEEFFEISKAFNQMMTRLSQDQKNVVEREKMAKEIEVASQIQKALLPRQLPEIPSLEVEAQYRAASVIGGDLYDIFRISEQRYCLTVADVSGKGVPASLVMSILRTVLQIQAASETSAKNVLTTVNRYLSDNIPSGMFITVFLVIYDAGTNKISLVSAGHNPMLYYRAADKKVISLNPKGLPLGVPVAGDRSFDNTLEELVVELKPEDMFLLYTDGITEARGRDNSQFGMDRLTTFFEEYLAGHSGDKLTEMSKALVDQLDDFTGFAKAADDITFVIARCSAGENGSADDESAGVQIKSLKEKKS
jgi:sigma-B regulation protein RsbU (phosphoserine phosphatase)